ncbi:MAG: aminoacetone oxidase family FAD-binding enzyme [Lachnospiraceae bacterium]|nr:aminoacetone oxidase family FAD-binding enzyme [Lachnospiraceae bacterium]
MMAAITAAAAGVQTEILESGPVLGKKILSTGNGRCNLTNASLDPALYQGSGARIAAALIKEFNVRDTVGFFDKIGIPTVAAASARGNDSWIYPACKEASAVRKALELECERLGVSILTDHKVISVEKFEKEFVITTREGVRFVSDRVILTTGGKAFPKSGSDGSGYELAAAFGHSIVSPLPALGALISDSALCPSLAGIRSDAIVSLIVNRSIAAEETGEVQFTEYGLSGIPVFQISSRAVRALTEGKQVTVRINLIPAWKLNDLYLKLSERKVRRGLHESGTLLLGLVPDKMVPTLLKLAGIRLHIPCSEISRDALMKLAYNLQNLEFEINDAKDFDACQVTSGGIPASEVSLNLESLKVRGLYFAGEILDVDGPCGGYNLQWAWTSGWKAGSEAAK